MATEHTAPDPKPELSMKVQRGMTGGYGWEVRASGPGHDVAGLLAVLEEADSALRAKYAPPAPEGASGEEVSGPGAETGRSPVGSARAA